MNAHYDSPELDRKSSYSGVSGIVLDGDWLNMGAAYILYAIMCGSLGGVACFGAGYGMIAVLVTYAVTGQLAVILLAALYLRSQTRGSNIRRV